jgi:hypothetical protein
MQGPHLTFADSQRFDIELPTKEEAYSLTAAIHYSLSAITNASATGEGNDGPAVMADALVMADML